MTFDQLLASVANTPEQTLSFPASWTQGRTAFGGLSAALALQALLLQVEQERALRSFSAQFIGPIAPDEPMTIKTQLIRSGKSSSMMEAIIEQNGQRCFALQALFAKHRDSMVQVPQSTVPVPLNSANQQTVGYIEGVMPQFFQHVDLTLVEGNMPYSNSTTTDLQGWMRFKGQEQDVTWAHAIALIDAWPPAQLQAFSKPAPASSMSWYVECFDLPQVKPSEWLGLDIKTTQASHGYANETATLVDNQGNVIAKSHQTVALFA